MKNIYEKVKRFGSPTKVVKRNFEGLDDVLGSGGSTHDSAAGDETDQENNRYDEYITKYAGEKTAHWTAFSNIYESELLGRDGSIYYKGSCGTGATHDYNKAEFVPFLRKFLVDNQIKTIVDLGCGNLGYDKKLYNEVTVKAYYGYDVYGAVQEHNRRFSNNKKYHFFTMDFFAHKEELVEADLCIIKDVLQHWTLTDITVFMDYLVASKKYKFIMIVNCHEQGGDMLVNGEFRTGDWRRLSSRWLPLRKYSPKPVLYYNSKEVSVIQCYLFGNNNNRTASPAKIAEREIISVLSSVGKTVVKK